MKRIIYVEDDRDTAEACKKILESAGYEVSLAYTGKEGVQRILHEIFDLALLDIMLPDMSGWDVFQKVKHKAMKFAFLSALEVSPERYKELHKAGLADYITKPFTKQSLLQRVAAILRK